MIKSTSDYDIFKFREDNREKIDYNHVKRLVLSITQKNLLELRPICVNRKMEIIDGQHRLLAAKELGVEVFYEVKADLVKEDIILMNISKSWSLPDYHNFYVKNDYEEYKKLNEFMIKHGISLKVALCIILGRTQVVFDNFKNGTFEFETEENCLEDMDFAWETINLIRKFNGQSPYTNTIRFWRPLLKLIREPGFNIEHWRNNSKKMIERFSSRVSEKDYTEMLTQIYNYRAARKISKFDEEES